MKLLEGELGNQLDILNFPLFNHLNVSKWLDQLLPSNTDITAWDHVEHQKTCHNRCLKQKLKSFTWGFMNKLIFAFPK